MKAKFKVDTNSLERNLHLELIHEMYRCYDFFNKHFKINLPRPVITIQAQSKRKELGFFCSNIWQVEEEKADDKKANAKTMHEISISAEALALGPDRTCETLLHEIAHMVNFENNIPDCNEQQRHNLAYKAAAEKLGLTVKNIPRYGWARTDMTDDIRKLLNEEFKPNMELFVLFRKKFNSTKPKKDNTRDLTPVMIGKENKKEIAAGAEKLGITQKEFVSVATKTLVKLPNAIGEAAIYLAKNASKMSAIDIQKYLLETLIVGDVEVTDE